MNLMVYVQHQHHNAQQSNKNYASPSITPQHNYRTGNHQREPSSNDPHGRLRSSVGNSNIQGRRIDSPELKVAVNKELNEQRPHTAGHPFLQYGHHQNISNFKKDDYMTIMNQSSSAQNGYFLPQNSSQTASNSLKVSHNHPLNMTTHNAKRSQYQQHFDFNIQNQKANATIQYKEDGSIYVKQRKLPSKSTNPHNKRKKQQSRSMIKYGGGNAQNNIHVSILNTSAQAQPVISINIQNAKMSNHKNTAQIQRKKHELTAKFNSQMAGQMSAPMQSKSRSRSQKRRENERGKSVNTSAVPHKTLIKTVSKPPKQPQTVQSRSIVTHPKGTVPAPFENAFSFDQHDDKENLSLNLNDSPPSRIIDNRSTGAHHRKKNSHPNITNFLDSDSSLSSPKIPHANPNQKEKSYFMDKSSFLKQFSPDRPSESQFLHQNHKNTLNSDGAPISGHLRVQSSERDAMSGKELKRNTIKSIETLDGVNSSKVLIQPGQQISHKISLRVVGKLMKEKFKHMKAKEDTEDFSRRKLQNEQLQKNIQKAKAVDTLSQRNANQIQIEVKKFHKNPPVNISQNLHKHKISQVNSGQINIQRVALYKKHRSKSCMNQTDNIFGGLPRSKERQQVIQQLAQIAKEQEKVVDVKPVKKREKSFVQDMKELKRECMEELKRDILSGKIEGLPAFQILTSNKRQSNMTTIQHKKNSKENQSGSTNQQSKGDLITSLQVSKKTPQVKHKDNSLGVAQLHPSLTTKIKKFMQKNKRIDFVAKSMEQTIVDEKKVKIQENLEHLFQSIKNKHQSHLRHQSFNFQVKKHNIGGHQAAMHSSNGTTTTINASNHGDQKPQKQLKPQFFKEKKVFNYKDRKDHHSDERDHSNSLTPARNSVSKILDNDVSMDDDVRKLRNSIQHRHLLKHGKGDRICNSNPPVANRRKNETVSIQNEFLEIQSVGQRGSSLKQEMRGYKKVSNKNGKKLVDELEERSKQKQNKQRKSNPKSDDTPASKSQNISSSSPATIQNRVAEMTVPLPLDSKYDNIISTESKNRPLDEGSNNDSNMYVDSDDEGNGQCVNPPSMLIANMSPLRNKDNKRDKHYQNRIQSSEQHDGSQFYPANSHEMEKVIVCSVITSARPDVISSANPHQTGQANEDNSINTSLKNSGTYVPLRSKPIPLFDHIIPTVIVPSVPVTEFNTAIKTIPEPSTKVGKQESIQAGPDSASNDGGESGARRNIVPSLNLASLSANQEKSRKYDQQIPQPAESESNKPDTISNRAKLFGRHPFQDFQENHHLQDFKLEMYPEMLRMREDAIQMKEKTEKQLLKQMVKSNQLTPRTYERKKLDLEMWVTKETEEVKKTKKVFEEELKKTQQIIIDTQKDQENMKRLINDQASSHTHRSKQVEDGDNSYSYRPRIDSHRLIVSQRNENKSYLDLLEEKKDVYKQSEESSTISKETPPENLNHNEPEALIQYLDKKNQQDQLEQRQLTLQFEREKAAAAAADQQQVRAHQEEIQRLKLQMGNLDILELDSNRPIIFRTSGKIKVVDSYSSDDNDDSEQSDKNIGFQKGLSRTKGSLQLHVLNDEIQDDQSNEVRNEDIQLMLGDDMVSTERRKNIHDQSFDIDNNNKVSSPDLLIDQIQSDDFFSKDFDRKNAQNIIDQVKRSSPHEDPKNASPSNFSAEKESSNKSRGSIYEGERPPMPPSPSPELSRVHINPSRPSELVDIHLQMPASPSELSNAPVSPNSDTVNVTSDTRIICGGGSLSSTLSAGENGGNQDLIKVIQEVQKEEEQSEQQHQLLVEQITDDIYQAMLGELRLDMEILLLNDQRMSNQVMLQGDQNSLRGANQQQQLTDSGRFLIFDRRGIQTDLFAIERYVEEVLQEVLLEKDRFLHTITEAISKNSREVLNQLQNSEIGSYEHFEQHFPTVLPLDTYLKLERRRKDQRTAQQENDLQSTQIIETRTFLAECEHIHNKVLFDCINDSLLQFKPYGKDGSPLPWSRQNRRLKPIEDFTIEEMFEIVKHDMFRWAIMQAGTLPRREFVFGGLFDEELFAEIREKKLATLLAREMIENEPRWLNYEFEEAQVKIDIGDMILEQLVTETISILNERMGSTMMSANMINEITSTFTGRMLLQ